MRALSICLVLATSCRFEHGNRADAGADVAPGCPQPWFDKAWAYRKQITISAAMVQGVGFRAFPTLIDVSADSDLAAHAQPNGDDIMFTSADGTTLLNHELEPQGQGFAAWVSVDLTSAADTVLYIYYGNPAVAAPTQQAMAVWSDAYVGVWHLSEDPTGTVPQLRDSAPSVRHATSRGMIASDRVDGRIGRGLAFDGFNNGVDLPSAMLSQTFSYSAWIDPNTTLDWRCIVNNNPAYNRWFGTYMSSLDFWDNIVEHQRPAGISADGGWYYVVLTYDGSQVRQYRDGALVGTPAAESYGATTSPAQIGYTNSSVGEWFGGTIDEVRISNKARSADFIATEYRNVAMPELIKIENLETCQP